jgi:hypothetical protein
LLRQFQETLAHQSPLTTLSLQVVEAVVVFVAVAEVLAA